MTRRKFAAALETECLARGLKPPPPEVAAAYAEAVIAMQTAVRERRRTTDEARRRTLLGEFRAAVAAMLSIRRSIGLAAERREYVGIRAARQAAARALGDDGIFSPLPVPPGLAGKAN